MVRSIAALMAAGQRDAMLMASSAPLCGAEFAGYLATIRLYREATVIFPRRKEHSADCALHVSVPVDKTAPTISGTATPAPNAAGWNNSDVTVNFMCDDTPSGIEACTSPVTLKSEGQEQHVDGTARDNAGNTTTVTIKHINIDKTPPVITCSVTPNVLQPADGKFVPVTATVNVVDRLSGPAGFTLVSAEGNEDGSDFGIRGFRVGVADTDGMLQAMHNPRSNGRIYTLTYRGMDMAGNTALCSATVSVPNDQVESRSSTGVHAAAVTTPTATAGGTLIGVSRASQYQHSPASRALWTRSGLVAGQYSPNLVPSRPL